MSLAKLGQEAPEHHTFAVGLRGAFRAYSAGLAALKGSKVTVAAVFSAMESMYRNVRGSMPPTGVKLTTHGWSCRPAKAMSDLVLQ